MYPCCTYQHEVESQTESVGSREIRKSVIEPLNPGIRVTRNTFPPHSRRGFDSHDVVPKRGKPGSVPSRTSANVKRETRPQRDQVRYRRMHRVRGDCLESLGEHGRLPIIRGDRVRRWL